MDQSQVLKSYLQLWMLRGRLQDETGPVYRPEVQEYHADLEILTEASGCDLEQFRILAAELCLVAQTPLVCRSVPLSHATGRWCERRVIIGKLNDLLRSFTVADGTLESVQFGPR